MCCWLLECLGSEQGLGSGRAALVVQAPRANAAASADDPLVNQIQAPDCIRWQGSRARLVRATLGIGVATQRHGYARAEGLEIETRGQDYPSSRVSGRDRRNRHRSRRCRGSLGGHSDDLAAGEAAVAWDVQDRSKGLEVSRSRQEEQALQQAMQRQP